MQTEAQALDSLRTQFAAAFRSMARAPYHWNVYQGPHNVILAQDDNDNPLQWPVLVANVHTMNVDRAVANLSLALREHAEKAPAPARKIEYAAEFMGSRGYVVRPIGCLGTHGFIGDVGWEAKFCDTSYQAQHWVYVLNSITTRKI